MNKKWIKNCFILAGLSNIFGALIFSRLFSNHYLNEAAPVVMSNFGLLLIMLWGLAYISVANDYDKVPGLIAVFILEKLIYVIVWIYWQFNNDLSILYTKDLLTGIFYTVYGINDIIFMLFFCLVILQRKKLLSKNSN